MNNITFYHTSEASHSYLMIVYQTLTGKNLYSYIPLSVTHDDENIDILYSAKRILFDIINKELDDMALESEVIFYFGQPLTECSIHTEASIPPNCVWAKWPKK